MAGYVNCFLSVMFRPGAHVCAGGRLRQIMNCSSNDEMRKLSQRNSELLDFARALEHRVTQLCQQQPENVCALVLLSTILFFEQKYRYRLRLLLVL